MRIALFHTTLPEVGRKPGGVDVAVHRLANALASHAEDEVTVLSMSPCPAGAHYKYRRLFENRAYLRHYPLYRWLVLPVLLNTIRQKPYDVIHLHGDDWFLFNRSTPTIRTLHGSALFEARTAGSLKRKLAQYCIYPLEHVSAKLATVTLAIGTGTSALYGLERRIDNGVDLNRFIPRRKSPHPQILFVGTWDGRKRGAFMFKQFVKHILPSCPNAELIMVCDRSPVHRNVRNVVCPDDDTLAGLFAQAWVFACPSLYEGFGIPYLEAMASGTAVVSTPNEGASYVLQQGNFGFVVSDEAFSDTIVELLIDEEKRTTIAEKALIRAKTYSWESIARRHRDVYQQALAMQQERGPYQKEEVHAS